ncbi:Bug family tripartite tricarboxylate transporter substrate binding protein [Meridianimarinicoccus sp. RP-17]|uniref:Bug family tripartite tricarboxylate transporter substrate binding protein n=1 Tax=Meridianimarinicoccus zhengii TaxID=2056810 RepID=UPI000DAEAF2E|nr:tripartite tricarboxylate transporter substrate-binding protein [Phycocomes zhengii]
MPAITKWKFAAAAAVAFGSIGFANPGAAQADDFLDGPVTMIVPFGAGGGTDQWARAMTTGSMDVTGQPMNVRNMPGASAVVGWTNLLDLPADGRTLIQASPTPMLALLQQENPPIDLDDIKIVAYVGAFRTIIATQEGMGWDDWDSFVEHLKANPGAVTIGATNSNLVGVATTFGSAGIEATLVPYASTSDATADFLGGHIDALAAPAADIAAIYPVHGQVIINASDLPLSDDFKEQFGNPPLATDIGLEGVSLPRWVGAHPDTPDEIVLRWSELLGEMIETPGVGAMLKAINAEVVFVPAPQAQENYNRLSENMRVATELLR